MVSKNDNIIILLRNLFGEYKYSLSVILSLLPPCVLVR